MKESKERVNDLCKTNLTIWSAFEMDIFFNFFDILDNKNSFPKYLFQNFFW